MSLGDTDKKWWIHIADWLANYEKRALVILKHSPDYNPRFSFSQQRLVRETVTKLLSYSSFLSDETRESLGNKIFPAGNHNVFAMNLRKKKQKSENISELPWERIAKETADYLESPEYKQYLEYIGSQECQDYIHEMQKQLPYILNIPNNGAVQGG